jgi:eukaryotic-like serine/threonine-protein kinase
VALAPGTRLGAYEVTVQIGAGGMGEVYRATDTNLKRQVAIKVLPGSPAADPERLARFQREAEVLATLNHPNIAAIYGLERCDGVTALVLELVEGPTLADQIAHGPILVDDALPIARQIADALEAAHEQNIVHRDLKPANIKLRPDGAVKVLDFGLAKAFDPLALPVSANVTASPTITTPAMMTGVGMILGTAAYMAPEQAKGRPADKRSDVWAFGCVLYEMLTGKRAFEGENWSETLAAVLRGEPDWTALPATVSPAVRMLVQRCLEKDRRRRVADISIARYVLTETVSVSPGTDGQTIAGVRLPLWRRVGALVGTAVVSVIMATTATWLAMQPAAPRVTRLTMETQGVTSLSFGHDLTFTPDGLRVIYVGNNRTQLFVRSLDALEPTVLVTGTGLQEPFVSPDGQWVGFGEALALKKVALSGGPAITLAPIGGPTYGATWMPDDTIIVGSVAGLLSVPAAGGKPSVVTQPDRARGEGNYFWPDVLPGGRAVLFTSRTVEGGADVAVRDLRTGAQKILLRSGSDARYVSSGHVVYMAGGTLSAVAFDVRRLEVRGPPVSVVSQVMRSSTGSGLSGEFAVAADGTLAYVSAPPGAVPNARTLVWVDRAGHEQPIAAPPHPYLNPRLSPDGTRIAVYRQDGEQDIWILDEGRKRLTRLTIDPAADMIPVWTPDGRRVIFTSNREGGSFNLWWQPLDGAKADRLATSEHVQVPTSISADGTALIFSEDTATTGTHLMRLALDGTERVTPLLQTRADELNGELSPDGHWLAYQSDKSGREDVYVRPYPDTGAGEREVSTDGGIQPVWPKKSKELFYLALDGSVMSVAVEADDHIWHDAAPVKLFQGRYDTRGPTPPRMYDVSPNGQRFLMLKPAGADQPVASPSITIVQHFAEELKQRVPVK